jgi:hypothetical protein
MPELYRYVSQLLGKYIRKMPLSSRGRHRSPCATQESEGKRVGKLLWEKKQGGFQIRILHVARPGGEEQFTDGGDNFFGSAA